MIQVEYKGNYILDIGWYPEGDEKGKIIIQLIHNNEWDKPIVREETTEIESLLKSINKIMSIIEDINVKLRHK